MKILSLCSFTFLCLSGVNGESDERPSSSSSKPFDLLAKVPKVQLTKTRNLSDLLPMKLGKFSLSMKTKAYLKARSLGESIGVWDQVKPDWMDSYHHTLDSAVELFEDMVSNANNFTFDDMVTSDDFCEHYPVISDVVVCKETIKGMMSTLANVMRNPWVLIDVVTFAMNNLSKLPWDHILNWEVLREYLHSIPKADLYADLIPYVQTMICSIETEEAGNMCYDVLPMIIPQIYREIMESDLGMDYTKPVEFTHVAAKIVDAEDHKEEVHESVDMIHTEVCYILSLEKATIDMESHFEGKHMHMKRIPVCLSPDYKAAHVDTPLYDAKPAMDISMQVRLSGYDTVRPDEEGPDGPDGTDDPTIMIPIELPNDVFFAKNKKKTCKWLSRIPPHKREWFCNIYDAPQGKLNAIEACPSLCCARKEQPNDIFMVTPKATQTCAWLSKLKYKDENKVMKICRFMKAVKGVSPAAMACPETCGVCYMPMTRPHFDAHNLK